MATKSFATLALAAALAACGGDSGDSTGNGGADSAANGTGTGSAANGTGAGGSGSGTASTASTSSGPIPTGSGVGGVDACTGDTQVAKLVPVDLVILFDSSGSMLQRSGNGQSKWDATRAAVKSFLAAPTSAGLGVGLEFFPTTRPGVPATCDGAGQCGDDAGPCFLGVCSSDPKSVLCEDVGTKNGCDATIANNTCIALGRCEKNGSFVCRKGQPSDCIQGDPAGDVGPCVDFDGYCSNGFSCDAADYAELAVDVAELPAAAPALVKALDAKIPAGNTPSTAALAGAVQRAKAAATANPTHATLVVLATDGLPEGCAPDNTVNAVVGEAQAGLEGSPSVRTYVIGTFSSDEKATAQTNLDFIAKAGGTDAAFVIDASSDVTAEFSAALAAIRGAVVACDYLVPEPPAGETLDYGRVNVKHTRTGGEPETVLYVGDAAECDAAEGGWYYDTDPAEAEPTKILLCPATCSALKQGGSVEMQLGCETEVPK